MFELLPLLGLLTQIHTNLPLESEIRSGRPRRAAPGIHVGSARG